jgi:hypothetical protein
MSADTKRREILQMLAKGSINAAEAVELLDQIKGEQAPVPPVPEAPEAPVGPEEPAVPGQKPRWLNVRVTDKATSRDKVMVRIPLSLARIGLRMGAKFAPEVEELDWDEIITGLTSGGVGTLVEVQDNEDGELVRVYVS